MKKSSITIIDVAEVASVSTATVSHVLNNTRYVEETTRKKVLDVMNHLGYVPNKNARSLRSGKTNTLGLIVPDISNQFYGEVCSEIENIGFDNGYNVILCNTNYDPDKGDAYIRVLLQENVDGIILLSTGEMIGNLKLCKAKNTPLVIADRDMDYHHADKVLIDNKKGGFQATDYLISLGHRKIACIAGPKQLEPRLQRLEGYKAALINANIEVDENLIFHSDLEYTGGIDTAKKILRGDTKPSAIFACNDFMAIGALKIFLENGFRVPGDISIVGFDNIGTTISTSPSLTTINQPIKKLASKAINLLIERIGKKQERTKVDKRSDFTEMLLDTELIIRNSCARIKNNNTPHL